MSENDTPNDTQADKQAKKPITKIKRLLKQRGISQRELAAMMGVSIGAVNRFCQRGYSKQATMMTACMELGVELWDVIGYECPVCGTRSADHPIARTVIEQQEAIF